MAPFVTLLTPRFAWYFFSSFFFLNFPGIRGQRGPRHSFSQPPGGRKSKQNITNLEDHHTSPYNKKVPYNFWCQLNV